MEESSRERYDEIFKRYEILIRARNFHYENYSKWMTYFYVAISAMFISFFTISSKTNTEIIEREFLTVSILLLGFVVSLLWYWSCKGYYFWNINFISLVNYYEEALLNWDVTERVYFVFANKKRQNNYGSPINGANISTSKVAIFFAYVITLFWGSLFFKHIFLDDNNKKEQVLLIVIIAFTIITIYLLSISIPKKFLYSDISSFKDLELFERQKHRSESNK